MEQRLKPVVLKNLFGPNCDLESLDWKPYRTGVEIVRIYGDPEDGPAAALLRYQPGAGVPLHEHLGYEHILILARTQCDPNGCNDAGTLIVNAPGSSHSVYNELGSVVLAIWERSIRFPSPAAPVGIADKRS